MGIHGHREHCRASVCLYLSVSVAVKFLWPVGGALMQCFKARNPYGSETREGDKEGGEEGEDAAAGTDAPLKTPTMFL